MNNKHWLNSMLTVCYLLISPAKADSFSASGYHDTPGALSWWSERNTLTPGSYARPRHGQANRTFNQNNIPPLQPPTIYSPDKHYYPIAYRKPVHSNNTSALKCENLKQLQQPGQCILRSSANLAGLHEQIRYLNRENPRQKVAKQWANVSNKALLQTAEALLAHENGYAKKSFQQSFYLYEVGSNRKADSGHYTGYFTPELQVQSYPDQQYRHPIYAPPRNGTRLSRSQIDNGALRNKGLEIAWTNDVINLYFAQIQGSAIARYPDGKTRYLNFAGHNNHSHRKISRYIKERGYVRGGLSNANIRRWLHQHPEKIDEVLHQNPRYIFFSLTDDKSLTATSTAIIPGHTVAVDDRYIPFGSVLLANIPRINHRGEKTGSDWRMLFAQDRGDAIKGPGRLDLYTGSGDAAEQKTYQLTGHHKTYLLVRKPDWN